MSDQTPPEPQSPGPQNSGQTPVPPPPPTYPTYGPGANQQPPGAYPPPAPVGYYAPGVAQRPGTVAGAAITTIVLASLGALIFGILSPFALAGNEDFIDGIRDSGGFDSYTRSEMDDIVTVIGVVALVFAIWSVVTIVTASLSLRRHNWARIITVITAGGWAAFGLFNLIAGSPVGILMVGAGVAVIILYFVGQANAWYSSKDDAAAWG